MSSNGWSRAQRTFLESRITSAGPFSASTLTLFTFISTERRCQSWRFCIVAEILPAGEHDSRRATGRAEPTGLRRRGLVSARSNQRCSSGILSRSDGPMRCWYSDPTLTGPLLGPSCVALPLTLFRRTRWPSARRELAASPIAFRVYSNPRWRLPPSGYPGAQQSPIPPSSTERYERARAARTHRAIRIADHERRLRLEAHVLRSRAQAAALVASLHRQRPETDQNPLHGDAPDTTTDPVLMDFRIRRDLNLSPPTLVIAAA